MDFNALNSIIFAELGEKIIQPGKDRGHKYHHGQRVGKQSVTLRKLIFPDDSSHDDILTVTGWFHDIRNGQPDHANEGAIRTRELLEGTPHLSEFELNEVCGIIAIHDDRYNGRDTYTQWAKLQQDADLIDHFGTFDVWNFFQWCNHYNKTIDETIIESHGEWFDNRDVYDGLMNYDISREIYRERVEYIANFIARFESEMQGEFISLGQV